jgi:uncharacterized Tic20 family protein
MADGAVGGRGPQKTLEKTLKSVTLPLRLRKTPIVDWRLRYHNIPFLIMENTQNPSPKAQLTSDEKTWGWLVHLCNFLGIIGLILTVVTLNNHKAKSEYLKSHATEALNWQLTVLIAAVVGAITAFVFVGFLIIGAVAICNIIFSISGIMKANNGELYKYPFSFKFVK